MNDKIFYDMTNVIVLLLLFFIFVKVIAKGHVIYSSFVFYFVYFDQEVAKGHSIYLLILLIQLFFIVQEIEKGHVIIFLVSNIFSEDFERGHVKTKCLSSGFEPVTLSGLGISLPLFNHFTTSQKEFVFTFAFE